MTKNQYDLILKIINRFREEFPPIPKLNLLTFIDEDSYAKSKLTYDEADLLIRQMDKIINP